MPSRAGRVCMFVLLVIDSTAALAAEDGRTEWNYEVSAGLRRIVDDGGGKWRLHFPNGTTAALVETDRTATFVQLRNVDNKNVMRLFSDYGAMQKGGQGPFRRFTAGKWVTSAPSTDADQDYRIRVVYFVPSDRQAVANHVAKIRVLLELAAEIMTDDLRAQGYQTLGPQFVRADGEIVVDLLRGKRTAIEYNQGGAWKSSEHGGAIFREVDSQHGSTAKQMTFIFAETYEPGTAPRLWSGHIALAAAQPPRGGVGVFSAWILRDEFAVADRLLFRQRFFDETPIHGRTALGHRGPNSPRAEFLEDGVGGTLHELAHMFGTTHHDRGAESNIMSQGFRNLRWNVGLRRNDRLKARFSKESAAMLMSSRYLNSEIDVTDDTAPKVELAMANVRDEIAVAVRARDDRVLRLLTLVEVTPKAGRQLIEARALTGTEQTVRLKFSPGNRASEIRVQAIVVDGGGNHTKVTKSFSRR